MPRGRPKKMKGEESPALPSIVEEEAESIDDDLESLESLSPIEEEIADNEDLFARHSQQIDQAILDMVLGIKTVQTVRKRQLLRGESEWRIENDNGEVVYVYQRSPDPQLLKFVREQLKGRAAAKEAAASKAATIVVKLAIPGVDDDLTHYLATLPDDVLAKHKFDPEVLEKIARFRQLT